MSKISFVFVVVFAAVLLAVFAAVVVFAIVREVEYEQKGDH